MIKSRIKIAFSITASLAFVVVMVALVFFKMSFDYGFKQTVNLDESTCRKDILYNYKLETSLNYDEIANFLNVLKNSISDSDVNARFNYANCWTVAKDKKANYLLYGATESIFADYFKAYLITEEDFPKGNAAIVSENMKSEYKIGDSLELTYGGKTVTKTIKGYMKNRLSFPEISDLNMDEFFAFDNGMIITDFNDLFDINSQKDIVYNVGFYSGQKVLDEFFSAAVANNGKMRLLPYEYGQILDYMNFQNIYALADINFIGIVLVFFILAFSFALILSDKHLSVKFILFKNAGAILLFCALSGLNCFLVSRTHFAGENSKTLLFSGIALSIIIVVFMIPLIYNKIEKTILRKSIGARLNGEEN